MPFSDCHILLIRISLPGRPGISRHHPLSTWSCQITRKCQGQRSAQYDMCDLDSRRFTRDLRLFLRDCCTKTFEKCTPCPIQNLDRRWSTLLLRFRKQSAHTSHWMSQRIGQHDDASAVEFPIHGFTGSRPVLGFPPSGQAPPTHCQSTLS